MGESLESGAGVVSGGYRLLTAAPPATSLDDLRVDGWRRIGTKADGHWFYEFADDQIVAFQAAVVAGAVLIVTRTVDGKGTLFAKLARRQGGEGISKPSGCGGKLQAVGGGLAAIYGHGRPNAARAATP